MVSPQNLAASSKSFPHSCSGERSAKVSILPTILLSVSKEPMSTPLLPAESLKQKRSPAWGDPVEGMAWVPHLAGVAFASDAKEARK